MSDQKPQLRELARDLQSLSWAEVKDMAIQLNMEFSKLKQIQEQSEELSDRVLSAMNTWLNSEPRASWAMIVSALIAINQNVLADEIEKKYCNQITVPPLISNIRSEAPTIPLPFSSQQPRKRRHKDSPPKFLSPSPTPSPVPPQPDQLTTTDLEELPGWQQTIVKESKKERLQRVRAEASQLQTQFVTVLGQAEFCFSVKEMESKTFLLKFCITLKNLPLSKKFEHMKFLEDERGRIESASSVAEVFRILREYWNYTDFALLHHIIKLFGDNETKSMMETYRNDLEVFERRTTIKDYEDATGHEKQIPYSFAEVDIAVHNCKNPLEYTLYEVRQIVESLAEQSCLEHYVPLVKKACIGSLAITIALPLPALELLRQVFYKEFLATLNIVSVKVRDSAYNKTREVTIFCKECLKVCACQFNVPHLMHTSCSIMVALVLDICMYIYFESHMYMFAIIPFEMFCDRY